MDPFEGFVKPKAKRRIQTKYVQLDAHFGQIDFVYFSCFFLSLCLCRLGKQEKNCRQFLLTNFVSLLTSHNSLRFAASNHRNVDRFAGLAKHSERCKHLLKLIPRLKCVRVRASVFGNAIISKRCHKPQTATNPFDVDWIERCTLIHFTAAIELMPNHFKNKMQFYRWTLNWKSCICLSLSLFPLFFFFPLCLFF